MPHNSLNVFSMGNPKGVYDTHIDLVSGGPIQIRDNSLESARQAANKYLEKNAINAYFLRVLVYPHNVIRENKMIAGAGADRMQKGMRKSYGRAMDVAARIKAGQSIFTLKINKKDMPFANEAFRRSMLKLPGRFAMRARPNIIAPVAKPIEVPVVSGIAA
jgi:large subunit ribosomal protein L10e